MHVPTNEQLTQTLATLHRLEAIAVEKKNAQAIKRFAGAAMIIQSMLEGQDPLALADTGREVKPKPKRSA